MHLKKELSFAIINTNIMNYFILNLKFIFINIKQKTT